MSSPTRMPLQLPAFESRDLAVLRPEVQGLQPDTSAGATDGPGLGGRDLHSLHAALPSMPDARGALDPRQLDVERLEHGGPLPAAPLPSGSLLQRLQRGGEQFESAFERVPDDAQRAGAAGAAEGSARVDADGTQEQPLLERSSSGLLAGLFGLLKSAAGTFNWPPVEKQADTPPEKPKDQRKG